jgi:hypothetical protein
MSSDDPNVPEAQPATPGDGPADASVPEPATVPAGAPAEGLTPGREISLGQSYNPLTRYEVPGRGNPLCQHDFEKVLDYDEWAQWTCTRCGFRVRYEVFS